MANMFSLARARVFQSCPSSAQTALPGHSYAAGDP